MLTGKGLVLRWQVRSPQTLVDVMEYHGCNWVCFVLNESFALTYEPNPETGEMETGTNQVLDWYYVEDVRRFSKGHIQIVCANCSFEEVVYLGILPATLCLEDAHYKHMTVGHDTIRLVDVESGEAMPTGQWYALGFWPTDCLFAMTELSPKRSNEVSQMIKAYECA